MGRVQDQSEAKMSGKQRLQSRGSDAHTSSKKRKIASKETEPSPLKDRRSWSPEEETALVKVLLEHKRLERIIPLQSKTATYWTELITLLYPGQNAISQRRLYDKVRRMHKKYNECKQLLQEGQKPWRNDHEETLYEFWAKIFVDDMNAFKPSHGPVTKVAKVSNGNSVKVVQVFDSSSEDEDEGDEEEEDERVRTAKAAPKNGPHVQASSASEEEEDDEYEDEDEDEDGSSPANRLPVHAGQSGVQAKQIRSPQELRKTASLPRDDHHKVDVKSGSKQSDFMSEGGNERKDSLSVRDRLPNAVNGVSMSQGGADRLTANIVKSLKAELFEYVQNLRNDCMRELDEVKSQLISPSRLQMARRRQELILEELTLQERELEISRKYCRLQKEALKLQS